MTKDKTVSPKPKLIIRSSEGFYEKISQDWEHRAEALQIRRWREIENKINQSRRHSQ